jgi:hypothetical protein
MRVEGMENLVTTGKIQGKKMKVNKREKRSFTTFVDGWI